MERLHSVFVFAAGLLVVCAGLSAAFFIIPDPVDVDTPMQDETAFEETIKCVLSDNDFKLCDTVNALNIKRIIRDLVKWGCSTCNDDDLKVFKFMAYLSNNKPNEWQQVLDIYDPKGEFKKKNSVQWKEHDIAV